MARITEVVAALTKRVEALENTTGWKLSYDAILSLMTLELATLKLTGVIDWWWFFVFSPLYLPISIAFISGTFIILIGALKDSRKDKE